MTITKKAAHAAQVEERKRVAYITKVRTLVGYAGAKVSVGETLAAYTAGKTAEAYATELAADEPVGLAIFPMKADAMKVANDHATKAVAAMTVKLEAAGWNLDVAAPSPRSTDSRERYWMLNAIRSDFARITKSEKGYHKHGEPHIVSICDDGVARYIAIAEREAAFEYDAFVCKMVAKVGPADSATIKGSHVWSFSVLTVRKGDKTECWHTQQIWNTSVLGKVFPQWPSRLLKGGAA